MIPLEKYFSNLDPVYPKSSFLYLRYVDPFNPKIFSNVSKLSFDILYPNIIIFLFNNGVLKFDSNVAINYIKKVEFFLLDPYQSSDSRRKDSKSLFGFLSNNFSSEISKMMHFTNLIFQDLVSSNPNIIEFDTDVIYYNGDLDLSEFPFKYEIENLKYYLPIGIKRSLGVNERCEIFRRGPIDLEKYKGTLIEKIRNDKIDLLEK